MIKLEEWSYSTLDKCEIINETDRTLQCLVEFNRRTKNKKSYGTATNVGAILFWLPGVVATQMNANEAMRAADDRINHLTRLKAKKNC